MLQNMLDFSDICENEQFETLPYINRIPKLSTPLNFKPQYIMSGDSVEIIYIPANNVDAQKLLNSANFEELESKYQLYKVNEKHMEILLNSIITTTGRFVYPIIFVNFIKSSLNVKTKINIPEEQLLKYRVWANQIREFNHHNKSRHSAVFDPKVKALGYQLCCELLHDYSHSVFVLSSTWPTLSSDTT